MLGTFVLTELAMSPTSSAVNVAIVHGWLGAHLVGAALVVLVFAASVPILLRRPEVKTPDGWRRLRLAHGRDVLTSEIGAWTHPEEAELCPEPAAGGPCMTLTRDDFGDVARDAGGLRDGLSALTE